MSQINTKKANRKIVRNTMIVTVAMFGFGYALVPLYTLFCQTLGINGQTEQVSQQRADSTKVDTSRTIKVRFFAMTNSKLPWSFVPDVSEVEVHPGELKRISYTAMNLSGSDIVGQAIHSVNPPEAAIHFKKTECFCYSQQRLASGESKQMPVLFMVDPELPEDVTAVTLSYTFLRADKYAVVN